MRTGHKLFLSLFFLSALAGVDTASAGPRGHGPGPRGPAPAVRRTNGKARVNTRWERKADKNHNGVVGPRESQHWDANHPGANHHGNPQAHQAFVTSHDANKDGKVDRVERKEWCKKHPNSCRTVGHNQPPQNLGDRKEVDKHWEHEADTDGNGTIDSAEFKSYKDSHPGFSPNHIDKKADRNHDGHVDATEREKRKDVLSPDGSSTEEATSTTPDADSESEDTGSTTE